MEIIAQAIAMLGVAFAVALAGTGSAIGIGYVGQVASGILREDPSKFGKMMLLVALPGTQGIYGFVVGFLLMNQLNLIAGGEGVTWTIGLGLQGLAAGLPIALAGLFSAIHQGKVCASGSSLVSKQPDAMGKALILGVFVEFYAVLGLLVSIFLINGIQV